MLQTDGGALSVEIFAAKDSAGPSAGLLIMAVPAKSGLQHGDTLRIDGLTMVAMRDRSILPVDFAELTPQVRDRLAALAAARQQLAVGEFRALGLLAAYFLNVVLA